MLAIVSFLFVSAQLLAQRAKPDQNREYAYGPAAGLPDSKVGTFTHALYDEAQQNGWAVISMKNEWRRVSSFEK